MAHFNQPNMGRINCVWTTNYKRLLEIKNVQHVEMKSVFTLQPIKRLRSMTVKIENRSATFWIFILRAKNLQLCCLTVTVHIVLQERRVATKKKKNHLHFWGNLSANQIQAHRNLNQKSRRNSIYGKIVSEPHWLIQLTKTSFKFIYPFIHFQSPLKQHDFLSLQRR